MNTTADYLDIRVKSMFSVEEDSLDYFNPMILEDLGSVAYKADGRADRIGSRVLEVKGDFCRKVMGILERHCRAADYSRHNNRRLVG